MSEITRGQLHIISGAFRDIREAVEEIRKQHPDSSEQLDKIDQAIEIGTRAVEAANVESISD